MLLETGRTADAGRIYARLLSPGPVTPATASAAADFHAAGGRIEEALGILESAAPAGDRGASARTRGALLRRHGRPEQASLLLEEAVAADPGDAGAWLELARLRLAGADFSAARSRAASIPKMTSTTASGWLLAIR